MQLHDEHLARFARARLERLRHEAERARSLARTDSTPATLRDRVAAALRSLAPRVETRPDRI